MAAPPGVAKIRTQSPSLRFRTWREKVNSHPLYRSSALFMNKFTTSLTAAVDGGTAVAAHVRRARGRGVRGAGLDEYDGLARPSAAGGRGRARNVPYVRFFRIVGKLRSQRALCAGTRRSLCLPHEQGNRLTASRVPKRD